METQVYHTQQAILIGSSQGDAPGTAALIDCRRLKNYLRGTLQYETTVLENPTEAEVIAAIENARTMMNLKNR